MSEGAGRVTARNMARYRRTPEKITELARDVATNRCLVTAQAYEIESAFYMILAFVSITPAAAKQIGALIGYYNEAVPGRAMNGYPIFTSVGFLHKADLPAFVAELARMDKALKGEG